MANKRLSRSADKKIGGVCAGIGEYFDIDPTIVRIIWIVLLVGYGFGGFLYVALWIIMPKAAGKSYEERMNEKLHNRE